MEQFRQACQKKGGRKSTATGGICIYSSVWCSGAGWFVQALAAGIAEAGGRVLLMAPLADPIEREAKHPDVERILLPRGAGGKGVQIRRLLRALWRHLVSIPLLARVRLRSSVFLFSFVDWIISAVFQMAWIRLLGAQLVFIVHDPKPHLWTMPRRLRGLELFFLRMAYLLPTHLVTLSKSAKQYLVREFRISADKITVIPHGAFAPSTRTDMPGNTKLLALGALRRNKNIVESVKAMSLLPDTSAASLVVAGSPHFEDGEYWKCCEDALASASSRVSAELGFLPEARVAELLADCDATLLPYEEFDSQSGVAVLTCFSERMIICTDTGGMRDLIEMGLEPVLIERPATRRTIADAVLRFEAMPVEERRAKATRSSKRLEESLSWKTVGAEYLALTGRLTRSSR